MQQYRQGHKQRSWLIGIARRAVSYTHLDVYKRQELAGIYIEEGQLDDAYSALNTPFLATTDKDISSHYYGPERYRGRYRQLRAAPRGGITSAWLRSIENGRS